MKTILKWSKSLRRTNIGEYAIVSIIILIQIYNNLDSDYLAENFIIDSTSDAYFSTLQWYKLVNF